MSFGILDILEKAAMMAAPIAVGSVAGPVAGAATGAALSGGRAAMSGASPEQALMAAGTSGATSAIGAGAGALGGMAGEAAGEGFKEVGTMAGRTMANAGIGALQGKSPQQIAMEQAQGLIPQGIQYLARGGAVTPALYADRYAAGGRVRYADGGMGDAMGGDFGGGGMDNGGGLDMGGGWGDAPTSDGGGYMDFGGGGLDNAANGAGILDTGYLPQPDAQLNPPASVAPAAPPAYAAPPVQMPYVAPPTMRATTPLVAPGQTYGFQNFNPAANPFGRSNVTAFAGGGRVGYYEGEFIYDEPAGPQFSASSAPNPMIYDVPAGPPAPERDWMDRTGEWWDRNKKWAAPVGVVGGLAALGTLGSMLSPKAKAPVKKTREQLQAEYPMIPYSGSPAVSAPVGYRPGISPEWNYFPTRGYAKGGGIGSLPGGEGVSAMEKDPEERGIHGRRVMDAAEAALNNNHSAPQDAIARFRAHFGDDALSTLMQKARRGDGMSDSLPATIDGKREAALASGEYVIPADVVSHLGNGSSQAGARELDLMAARARKARTGTAKQAPALKAGGLLPS